MAPLTRKQRTDELKRTGELLSLSQGLRPTKRKRRPPPSPAPVTTPERMLVHYEYSDWNRHMNAPFPEDNSDIPPLDLGEPKEEFTLWERADMAWKERCEKRARERKARIKRQGGVTKRQRIWARKQNQKEKDEIIEWFQEKLREKAKEEVSEEGGV